MDLSSLDWSREPVAIFAGIIVFISAAYVFIMAREADDLDDDDSSSPSNKPDNR